MCTLEFPTDGTSEIRVIFNQSLGVKVERKFLFGGNKKADFYENGIKIVSVSSSIFRLKIEYQNLKETINCLRDNLFFTKFSVGDSEVKVVDNPLYIFYPKLFSIIYWNGKKVGVVQIKKMLNLDGIVLEIEFSTKEEHIQYYALITYLVTCISLNI